MKPTVYRFHIQGFAPDTIPMARLAEYMDALARMLGEVERVHFMALEEGSVILCQQVEPQAAEKVRERVAAVQRRTAPDEALKAADKLNALLEKDNTAGGLFEGTAELIPFPGVNRPRPVTYTGIKQAGELDGWLARIGGRDNTAHALLVDGERTYSCEMTWSIARVMAKHLAGPTLRVFGTGSWNRTEAGVWELKLFRVREFEVLEAAPLPEVIERLRTVPGNGWLEMEDPHQALADFRRDGETFH